MKKLSIVDTSGFLYKQFYAIPPLFNKNGFPTNMLTGFMNFILSIGKDFKSDYIIFAIDSKEGNIRKELDPSYKEGRKTPDELKAQLPIAISFLDSMGFKTATAQGYEADDVIASLVAQYKGEYEIEVVSHDKDLYQLIDDKANVHIFDPSKRAIINEALCFEKYHVLPIQFTDYQALIGDSSDNIKGVAGIGKKTAVELLHKFTTLNNIYNNINSIEKPRTIKLLNEGKENAYLSKRLVTLYTDCYRLNSIEEANYPIENPVLKISNELLEYGLKKTIQNVLDKGMHFKTTIPKDFDASILAKEELVDNKEAKEEISLQRDFTFKHTPLTSYEEARKIIESIPNESIVALDSETTSLDSLNAECVGFSFAFNEVEAYYVPIAHAENTPQVDYSDAKELLELFIEKKFKIIYQNYKYDYVVFRENFNLIMPIYHDTMIMAWIYEQDKKGAYSIDKLALDFFNYRMLKFQALVPKNKTFADVEIEKASFYASEDAVLTFKVYLFLKKLLEKRGDGYLIDYLLQNEYPFIEVLSKMEENGIKVDTKYLQELENEFMDKALDLVEQIREKTGYSFNIKSASQLSTVLFENLGLPKTKKTKTGFSTKGEELLKIADKHEAIPLIIEYKSFTKLLDTYTTKLIPLASEDEENMVHSDFSQVGTATGRLASSNPNLQNIPVKSEAGLKIRKAFVSSNDNFSLVAFDYSQIELRLLAHFSKDEKMIEAFNNGEDIHLATAIRIFGEENAKEKRAVAKAINFGLIYGMGYRKLAQDLGVSSNEAKSYIDTYFETFPTIKKYLGNLKTQGIKDDYIEMIFGRKRILNYAQAKTKSAQLHLEREAVNSKFQGSASDIIKKAMIEIHNEIKDKHDILMLLQIHDELIFEIKNEKIEEYSKMIIEKMCQVTKLEVPLEVSFNASNNWADLKD